MIMSQHKDRISIQVGLSGYSFRIWDAVAGSRSSEWMPADRIFTTSEFQRRYDDVSISVFTPKVTLVPSNFYSPERAKDMLAEVVSLSDDDVVESVPVPQLASVMIYSNLIVETLSKVICETVLRTDGSKAAILPEMYFMLTQLGELTEYNKVLASYMDGVLYLVIAQGKSLMLCNSYQAPDFTTAQYFIFLAMKKLQLNPEVSTITFRTRLDDEDEMSLYRYFKSVDHI